MSNILEAIIGMKAHHESGYRSARQMQRIDMDKNHGIVGRRICNIGMIRAAT